MCAALGTTMNLPVLDILCDLAFTDISIRKLAHKYSVDSKILHNWLDIVASREFRRDRDARVKSRVSLSRTYKPRYAGPRLYGDYLVSTIPKWWKGASQKGRMLSHVLVCCKKLGLDHLPDKCCVHHINGIKTDNRVSNLALMLHKDHAKIHRNARLGRHLVESDYYLTRPVIRYNNERPDRS